MTRAEQELYKACDKALDKALEDSYDIYVACLKGSGEYIKSFDEWLNS